MIVKMSKYAFMVYHREYDAFLTTLRELGVVHVKETNSVLDNAELQALLAERKQVSTAIRYCKNLNSQTKEVTVAPRNSQPMIGLIRMPDMSQLLKSTPFKDVR